MENSVQKHSTRYVYLALSAIFLLASVIFFLGYDYELPILHVDEGMLLGITLDERSLIDTVEIPSYPPVIMVCMYTAQSLVEWYTNESAIIHTTDVIMILRILNVAINLLTLIFVYLFTSQLGNRVSGLIAAFAFAIMPEIFVHIRLALTESYQLLFISVSLYAAVKTHQEKNAVWAILCTIFGLLTVCAKYSSFPVLGLGVGVVMWLIWQDNKRWWRVLAVQILLIAASAYLVLYVYNANNYLSSGRPLMRYFINGWLSNLFNLQLAWESFAVSFSTVGLMPILSIVLLALGTYFYTYQQKNNLRIVWFLMIIFASSHLVFVGTYLNYEILHSRYVLPISTVWLGLAAVSITVIGQYVLQRFNQAWLSSFVVALLCLSWLLPATVRRVEQINNLTAKHTLVGFSEWSQSSLPSGTIAIDGLWWGVFDPLYGGYKGPLRPWVNRTEWSGRPVDEWIENYVFYLQYSGEGSTKNPNFSFELEDILYLKSFPIAGEENQWSGPPLHIYRVWDMEHETSVVFGENIILRGYDLSSNNLSAGDSLTWTPYWSVNNQPEANYQVFLHLVPMDNFEVVAQADGTPALATRPTITWNDPNETIIGNSFSLSIPENIELGEYRLIAGLYELESFARLTTDEAVDYFVIDSITISS